MTSSIFSWNTLTAAFLVAGTAIGGGMLALPVASAQAGFFPSFSIMILVWLMMTASALFLVEVGLWMKKEDAHFMSMSSSILGKPGKWFSWCVFLFISYASIVAYVAGCGGLIAQTVSSLFSCTLSKTWGSWIFVLAFSPFLFTSRNLLGKANNTLFFIMIGAYILLIFHGLQSVNKELLFRQEWKAIPLCVPLMITAFSFHTMVPSLHAFLHHDKKALRVAIVSGTLIAFVIYLVFQLVIFGNVPLEGSHGLLEAFNQGLPATYSLGQSTHLTFIAPVAHLFAFLALVTSFFGIGMGLTDFLHDGLKIKKQGWGLLLLAFLVLAPSLFFALNFERIFIVALDISGGFGDTLYNGILPLVMFWVGYKKFVHDKKDHSFLRKASLVLLIVLYLVAFSIEAFSK